MVRRHLLPEVSWDTAAQQVAENWRDLAAAGSRHCVTFVVSLCHLPSRGLGSWEWKDAYIHSNCRKNPSKKTVPQRRTSWIYWRTLRITIWERLLILYRSRSRIQPWGYSRYSINEKENEDVDIGTARITQQTQLDDEAIGPILHWKEELIDCSSELEEVVPPLSKTDEYFSQWGSLEVHEGVLYHKWETPDASSYWWKIVVPKKLIAEGTMSQQTDRRTFWSEDEFGKVQEWFHWIGCSRVLVCWGPPVQQKKGWRREATLKYTRLQNKCTIWNDCTWYCWTFSHDQQRELVHPHDFGLGLLHKTARGTTYSWQWWPVH